jgi:hypothetical protein
MTYLDNNGYVVIKEAANKAELEKGIDLAWNFFEGLGFAQGSPLGIDRNVPSTWGTPRWPDPFRRGIVASDCVGQSDFLWFCRGLDNVQKIFRTIWNVDDLITSFDGFGFHRAFEYDEYWKTSTSAWFHTDQNGLTHPEKLCVQGFLNFFESGVDDGGLVVVPGSHLLFNHVFNARPHLLNKGDFISVSSDESLWNGEIKTAGLSPIKVCCGPGDFVLWDSRTIHCNSPASTLRPIPTDGTILPPRRVVAYICMTPASRLNDHLRGIRKQAFYNGDTTSHWPEKEFEPMSRAAFDIFDAPELNESQKKLIPID